MQGNLGQPRPELATTGDQKAEDAALAQRGLQTGLGLSAAPMKGRSQGNNILLTLVNNLRIALAAIDILMLPLKTIKEAEASEC
jgi:hypothetical protein